MNGDPYQAVNMARAAQGLQTIRTASMGGAVLPMPSSWKPRPAAPPTRAATPARAPSATASRGPMPLVWMVAGLAGPGRIEGRGHAGQVEGFTSEAVARAAEKINAGYVPFRLSVDHGPETLATVADGRLQVRYLGGDLVCRWWPRERDRWIIDQVREREHDGNSVGASIESRNTKASTSGDVRLIESGDIVGISICLRAGPAYWRSGVVCGDGAEGELDDLQTAMRYVARADGATRL